MAAIITQRFRKNNVQAMFDDMTRPSVIVTGATGSSAIASSRTIILPVANRNIRPGMLVQIVSQASGSVSVLPANTLVAGVSTDGQTITLTGAGLGTANLVGGTLSFTSQYYIGLGKSDAFVAPSTEVAPLQPVISYATENDAQNNLIIMRKVIAEANLTTSAAIRGDAGYVIPRVNWLSGNYYKAWDSTDLTCFYPSQATINGSVVTLYPCYAIYNGSIYICVTAGYNSGAGIGSTRVPATTVPRSTIIGTPVSNSADKEDFYQWVLVSTIGLDRYVAPIGGFAPTPGSLDSSQFVKILRNSAPADSSSALTITTSTSSSGKVYSIKIVNGGNNYSAGDVFTVNGDGGTACTGSVIVTTGGAITGVAISASGSGYTSGTITIIGNGSGAELVPSIAPLKGFGYDAVSDLLAFFAGFSSTFATGDTLYPTTGGDIPLADKFRQVSLIRNPVVVDSNANNAYRCLKSFHFTSASITTLAPGDVIQDSYGARAFVDHYDTTSSIVYYHQNTSSFGTLRMNTRAFTSGATIVKRYAAPGYDSSSFDPAPAYDFAFSQTMSLSASSNIITVSGRYPQILPGMVASGSSITTGSVVISNTYANTVTAVALSTNALSTTQSAITFTSSTGQGEYSPNSGEVLFLQNFKAVQQGENQTEQVSLVIQF
jgi:hypothetical protein